MLNYDTIKESDSFARPNGYYNSVQLIELNDGYMMKDELPCYWLVGVVAYIDYNERFVGEIQHFTNLEDAKEEYSKQCDIFGVAESEVFNG